MVNVLYIHGMGGGADSRIPSILNDALSPKGVSVIVRTYDFDPDAASVQIGEWVEELKPSLIIGESLGALHAIRIKGIPHLLVSPALNAPFYFSIMSLLVLIPGVSWIFDRIYKPREGDRQSLHFSNQVLKKYPQHRKGALSNSCAAGSKDVFKAYFGTCDHYRRSGVVSVRSWKKHFGDTFEVYVGTHFMEDAPIFSFLIPDILNILNINK